MITMKSGMWFEWTQYARDIIEGERPFDENMIFINKTYSPNDLLTKTRELLDNE